jgi:hypothetical protein
MVNQFWKGFYICTHQISFLSRKGTIKKGAVDAGRCRTGKTGTGGQLLKNCYFPVSVHPVCRQATTTAPDWYFF